MASFLIIEPNCDGHRMQYVRWIAREALSRGHEVDLATSGSCLAHPLYLAMQRDCREQVRVSLLPEIKDARLDKWFAKYRSAYLIWREIRYYRLFSRYFSNIDEDQRPDFVFVPYLDYCVHAIGLLGSPFGAIPWGGVALRAAFHFDSVGVKRPHSKLDPVKKKLFYRALRGKYLQRMFTIDETLTPFVAKDNPALAAKLEFAPDPVEVHGSGSRSQARELSGISEGAVVLLVYGALSTRKGVGALLEAMRCPDFPASVEVLLAGKQHTEVKTLLTSPFAVKMRQSGRIHEADRVLDDEEEHMAFLASDMVWMGYQGHYMMSGVLLQAGTMGLPVLACKEGLIGHITRKHELGLVVNVDEPRAVAAAVKRLADNYILPNYYANNGKELASRYSPERFARIVLEGINEPYIS